MVYNPTTSSCSRARRDGQRPLIGLILVVAVDGSCANAATDGSSDGEHRAHSAVCGAQPVFRLGAVCRMYLIILYPCSHV